MSPLRRFAGLLLLGLTACAPAPDQSQPPFRTRTYQTASGETAHYVLFVPPSRDPAVKLPVILFLNGWGENGDDGLRQISNNLGGDLWRMRATFPFLVVCPQCTYDAEWIPGSKNADLALGVLDEAIREFNGDPDRVAITGASTGGTGAINIALTNPERFAAIVPVSTSIYMSPALLAKSRLPIWNFYNCRDSSSLVRIARQARRSQFEAGASPLVTEFDQTGHNAWDAAYASPALYRWLLEQNRQNGPTPLFAFQTPETMLTNWRTSAPERWRADGADLVCSPGPDATELLSKEVVGDWASHFDLNLSSRVPAVVALQSPSGGRVELVFALADENALLLRSPGGLTRHVGDPAAQRALRPGWNDVRLTRARQRFTVSLNGWPALDVPDPAEGGPSQLVFLHPGGDAEQRFRFVRTSPPASAEAAP